MCHNYSVRTKRQAMNGDTALVVAEHVYTGTYVPKDELTGQTLLTTRRHSQIARHYCRPQTQNTHTHSTEGYYKECGVPGSDSIWCDPWPSLLHFSRASPRCLRDYQD